jgi:hypothetical protein
MVAQSQQDIIDQSIRMALGDMHVQLILARARIQELEQQLVELQATTKAAEPAEPPAKPNGSTLNKKPNPPV